ncbi:MAG: hypothetical protein LBR10_15295 [Prevotellaceae bacterium]|jgi:hypothetical protein|nr:hypothetical protein [Prevotellaceae bacterium]
MDNKEFFQWTEQEIIDFFLTSNKRSGLVLPVVMKGLSSVLMGTPIVAVGLVDKLHIFTDTPLVNEGLILPALFLEGGIAACLACANVFNEKPKKILENYKFLETLKNYYNNLKAGDEESRNNRSKESAIDYYDKSLRAALTLGRDFGNAFEKKPWLVELFKADALSYLGSINTYKSTSTGDFSVGADNFKNALGFIDMAKKHNAFSIDRELEIASFGLANELRDLDAIESFIQDNKMQNYDKRFTPLIAEAEKWQNESAYSLIAGSEIVEFLSNKDNYTPKKKAKDTFNKIAITIPSLLKRNGDMKLNKALGRYYSIKGAYDLILLKYKIGDPDTNISEVRKKTDKALMYLTRSYCNDSNMTVDKYLMSSTYNSELQIALARNFTVLYALGYYTQNPELREEQLEYLSRAYRKNKNKINEKKFFNSIDVAIGHVLKPLDLQIENTDNLIEKIISKINLSESNILREQV